ncbi:MAG: hypothetical protein AAF984_03430 [Verrucomicrobiota bacterium]
MSVLIKFLVPFAVGITLMSAPLHARESYTWYASSDIPQASPLWLENITSKTSTTLLAKEVFSIVPENSTGEQDLAVTLFFDEAYGSLLRLFWRMNQSAITLSENLYEGVGMKNRRTLVLPAKLLRNGGELILLGGESTHSLIQIEFSWLQSHYISIDQNQSELAYVDASGEVYNAYEISGDPPLAVDDVYDVRLVKAPLIDKPQRIEDVVEFVFELESMPDMARVEAKLSGLPMDARVTVWVNQEHRLPLQVMVPPLNDAGYLKNKNGTYIGWRRASVFIPQGILQEGSNRLMIDWEISQEQSETGVPDPVAVRDLSLELIYDPTSENFESYENEGEEIITNEETDL